MKSFLLGFFLLAASLQFAKAQVGIGTESPHASAALEIQSTDKGLLIPRLSQVQKNELMAPATGLLIYQTNIEPGFYYFDGTSWVLLKNLNQKNADWEADSGETEILNKPDLSKVALSGDFSDLEQIPAIVFASDTSKMLLPFLTLSKIQPFLDLKVDVSAFESEIAQNKGDISNLNTVVDQNTLGIENNGYSIDLKEDTANKSADITLSDETNTKFPTELAVKTFVNAFAAAGSEALTEEVDRATAAEEKLGTDLATETTRATDAENTLTTNLDAETTRAMAAEDKLNVDLATETTRAIDAENTINTYLAIETTRATDAENTLTTNLAEEATRAMAAENKLTADLADETNRAIDAENTISTDLVNETTRATVAEDVLQGNIETVQENVDANQTAAETAIALKEDAANKSEDVTLSDDTNTKFPTELAVKTFVNASAAAGSEALTEEVNRATAAEEKLTADLATESSRATEAENTLTTNLDAETTRAMAAENKLTADLADETNRAIDAENTLTTDLSTETSRAIDAEGLLQGNIETVQDDVDTNQTAAETAIALKEDAANKSADITLSDETNTKFPTELAVKTFVNASAAAGSEALTEEVDRATTAEIKLAEDLEAETTRATGAENTLTTDLATETIRATDAEGVLQGNIETVQDDVDANQTAAETAIALKEDTANKSADITLSDETNTKFPTELAVKTFVNASAATGSEALTEEVDRATAAEEKLAEDLEAETSRATEAENTLTTNLAAETTRATAAEGVLQGNIETVQDNVDTNKAATDAAIALKEDAANKSTDVTLADETDTKFPTEHAVKTYVEGKVLTLTSGSEAIQTELDASQTGAGLDTDGIYTANAETNFLKTAISLKDASEKLDTQVKTNADAISSNGTNISANATDISGLDTKVTQNTTDIATNATNTALKENSANKSTDVTLADETDTKFPTAKAVKSYVDAKEIDLSTNTTGILPIANGGTGSGAQNFVDLTTDQTIAGNKSFSTDLKVSGLTVGGTSGKTLLGVNVSGGSYSTVIGNNAVAGSSYAVAIGRNASAASSYAVAIGGLGASATKSYSLAIGGNTPEATGTYSTAIGGSLPKATADRATAIGSSTTASGTNSTALGYGAEVSSSNTIQLGNTAITDVKTSGTLTAGEVTYPKIHGTTGQVLSTTGTGLLTWVTPSTASSSDFVDLTTDQTINGIKSFGANVLVNGITVGGSTGMMGSEPSNTFLGYEATTGESAEESTAIGNRASASGPQSIALGSNAQANQTQGISIGYYSSIASGYGFAIGSYSKSNAEYSVALGAFSKTEGNHSIALGYEAIASAENSIALGKNATVSTVNTIQLGNTAITDVKTSGKLTTGAITLPNTDGTSGQVLSTDGSGVVNWVTTATAPSVREVADEFTATASQTSFTLTQTPSANSKVKMYVNGIRISNTAYSVSGTTLTYTPANNGSYELAAGDRIQMDYYY